MHNACLTITAGVVVCGFATFTCDFVICPASDFPDMADDDERRRQAWLACIFKDHTDSMKTPRVDSSLLNLVNCPAEIAQRERAC